MLTRAAVDSVNAAFERSNEHWDQLAHPYRADVKNLPIKERHLSGQDLRTFGASGLAATVVMWDRESVDAAVHLLGHPAAPPVEVFVR
jgi:hypothetical protein